MTFGEDNACDICEDMILEFKPVILGLATRFYFIFQRVFRCFIEIPNPSIAKRVELPAT